MVEHQAESPMVEYKNKGRKMRKPRIMPKEGYYVYKNKLTGPDVDVVYTTGVAGKGGHMYYRVMQGSVWGWSMLLWTCVPGKQGIGAYTYYPQCPPGIPAKPPYVPGVAPK